jgi:tetratricopeptide (TPR) repeat protein
LDREITLPKVQQDAGQILSRALHPDPERRFGSAEAMAQALEAIFEPKRRGIPQVGLAAALVVCVAACGWLFVRQRELSRDLAETTALLRREQGVLGFLASAFGAPAVVNTPEKTAHSRALLNEAVEAARRNHAGSPDALAARLNSLTQAYNQLGDYQTALNLGKEAVDLNRARIRRETTELADTYGLLAVNHYNLSQYAESAEAARRASDLWRRLRPLDPESLASALSSLGQAYGVMGRYADADGPLSEAVAIYKKHGIDGSLFLDALRARGVNLTRQGLPEEGLPMLREAVERFLSEQGNTSFSYLSALNDLGNALALSGRLPEAAARQSDLIGVVRKVMGAESPNLAISHLNLASTLTKLNNLERAGAELDAGIQIFRKSLGESHPRFGEFLRASGDLDSRAGRHNEALATLRQALAHEQKSLPPGSLNAALTTASLAMAQQRAGLRTEARQTAQEALALLKDKLPETHPTLGELRAIP